MKYTPLDILITRIPLLPYESRCRYDFDDPQFNEAIFISSPELYEQKCIQKGEYSPHMRRTLYKYWSRAATRCTPFGLFSSWGIANIGDNCSVKLQNRSHIVRHDRLDMSLLCALIRELECSPVITGLIKYYPNESLMRFGDKYRYTEYQLTNERRHYFLQEINWSEELEKIIAHGGPGLFLSEAINLIVGKEINTAMAQQYIEELIQSHILVSELEVDISCESPLEELIEKLSKRHIPTRYIKVLESVNLKLSTSFRSDRHNESDYETLLNLLNPLVPNINRKRFLQTDSFRKCSSSAISSEIIKKVCEVISTLSSLAETDCQEDLKTFIQHFSNKFDAEKIPLLLALDHECGVGYPFTNSYAPIDPLIDGLSLSQNQPDERYMLSSLEAFTLKQMLVQGMLEEVSIEEFISSRKPSSNIRLPSTMSALFQINKDSNGDTRILMKSFGGATASALIGRVAYLDGAISSLFTSICKHEQASMKDQAILAEIVHMPQDRTGNVICRPSRRRAEIHILSHASPSKSIQLIKLDNLEISYDNERLHLTLRDDGREVIPILSNAHNYTQHGLPIYHFLCDYQYYALGGFPSIDISGILRMLNYAPRIVCQDVILSLRTWRVTDSDIGDTPSKEDIELWRARFKIPLEIVICDFDNELYINFEDSLSSSVFVETLRHKKSLVIKEVFGEPEAIFFDDENKNYLGEICLSLCKEKES